MLAVGVENLADLGRNGRLGERTKAQLRSFNRTESYQRGQIVMLEGSPADRVLLVQSGELALRKTNLDGRELIIARRRSGELVGDLAAVTTCRQATSVVAITDASAVAIGARVFRDLLATCPDLTLMLAESLATRLSDTSEQLLELATDDGMSRICKRLVRLAGSSRPEPRGATISISIGSQEELASSVGLQRSAVVKHLKELRRLGWVDTSRGVIRIHQLDSLRDRGARGRADRADAFSEEFANARRCAHPDPDTAPRWAHDRGGSNDQRKEQTYKVKGKQSC